MTPINNSDLAWLIVSDYNQDHEIGFPEALREDVYIPEINNWEWCYNFDAVGAATPEVGSDFGRLGIRDVVGTNIVHGSICESLVGSSNYGGGAGRRVGGSQYTSESSP